ncbi:hypothetical protein GWK47_047529 [Chionoecetes opilio]|uniref:Uncharacterized protein n=1 Tax=Chionoecetes opilio TaxID=41210 RepID=A0A8J4YDJ6_CHIOP|nr:hypothetical protein GWK47_047529 [Chionoecetes opilio]
MVRLMSLARDHGGWYQQSRQIESSGDSSILSRSMFPNMKTNQSLKIIGGHILALLAFMMSDPWENNLSTAAELGMAVLYLTNTSTQAASEKAGNMAYSSSLFLCFSEHQRSNSFPILLEGRVELVPSVAVGPGLVKAWK